MNEIERILAYHRNAPETDFGAAERKNRILVVEGDGFTRITLMNCVTAAGFDVEFAPNGRLGLHQLRMWKPDAIIMEINLRDLAGLDLIKKAREDATFRDRPIYVFTSTHFVRSGTRKQLAAAGVKVFDKLSIGPELFVVTVANELLGGELAAEKANATTSLRKAPNNLSGSMEEIWKQAKNLASSVDPKKRIEACPELREKVYSLLSHAAVGGYRKAARQAKALVDFLDQLSEHSQEVNDSALLTVARSVEVLSSLALSKNADSEEAAKFKVVVVGETPASCESIKEALQSAGLDPVSFADPAKALEHLTAEPADLIISNLPADKQDALDVAKIRALQLHQETPVIVAPQIAPETGDGSLPADTAMAEPESVAHTGLLMQALNILQKSAVDDSLAPTIAAEPGPSTHEVQGATLTGTDRARITDDPTEGRLIKPLTARLETPQEPLATVKPAAQPQVTAAGRQTAKKRRPTVLFVEDDPILLKVYKRALKAEGFRVEIAEDGLAAVESLPKVRPDLVVLDLMLPKLHGLEVLKFIRADVNLKATPVVILSNAFMEGLATTALKAGANKGLVKCECTPAKLVETIAGLLPKPAATGNSTDMGQYEADTAFVAYGENGETSIWTRKSNSRRDAPTEIAKIRQASASYLKSVGSPESTERLSELYRRVRFFGARAGLCGFTKLSEVAGAFEALLFEIVFNKVQPNPSILQSMAQAVDCLGTLVEKNDTAFTEPVTRPKVLMVDDDVVCTLATISILKHAKIETLSARDPHEGLRMLESQRFDLVILDVEMPGMDGFQLCEKLRRLPQYKTCPVVFLTGNGDVSRRARGLLVGGNDFVIKPITAADLILKLTLQWVKSAPKADATSAGQTTSPSFLVPGESASSAKLETPITLPSTPLPESRPKSKDQNAPTGNVVESRLKVEDQPTGKPEAHQAPTLETAQPPTTQETPSSNLEGGSRLDLISGNSDTNSTDDSEDARELRSLFNAEPPSERDLLTKYEKERQTLVTRVYTSENDLYQERARVKRRDATIEALKKQLEELQQKSGTAEGSAEDQAKAREAEARCRQLETELAELQKAREELGTRVASEQQQAAEHSKRSKDLEDRLAERSTELERAKAELDKQSNDRSRTESELREQLTAVAASQNEALGRCRQLELELEDLRKARKELDATICKEQEQKAQLVLRSKDLEKALSERLAEVERAKADFEKQTREKSQAEAELWKELDTVEAAQKRSQQQCQQLEAELADLRKAREELDAKLIREQQVATDLNQRSQELEARLGERTAELERSRAELELRNRAHSTTEAELWKELEAAVAARTLSQNRCGQLETELAELRKVREELEARVTTGEKVASESAEHARQLEVLLKTVSTELESAKAEVQKSRNERSQSEQELRRQLDALLAEQKQSQTRCGQLEADLASLRQARDELNEKFTKEQGRALQLEKNGKELEKNLQQRSFELDRAKTELEQTGKDHNKAAAALRKQLETMGAGQIQAQERCRLLEKELFVLREAREELASKASRDQDKVAELGKHGKALEQRLAETAREFDLAKADFEKQHKAHSNVEAQLRRELAAASARQKEAQERCLQFEAELASLRQAREELHCSVAREQGQAAESGRRSKELELRLGEASAELERARMDLNRQAEERSQAETELREQLTVADTAQKESQERCKQLEQELSAVQQARNQLDAMVASEKEASTQQSNRSKDLEKRLAETLTELRAARADLDSRVQEHSQAEAGLRQQLEKTDAGQRLAQERCRQLEAELATLSRSRDELSAKLTGDQNRVTELDKRSKDLEKHLKASSIELDRAKAELDQQRKEHSLAEAQLRQQLEATSVDQKQAQGRCSQLEADLETLRQAREELKAAVTSEQGRNTELDKRSKDLEKRLKASSLELERAKAELEKQNKERALAEAELRRQLETTNLGQKQAQARFSQLEGELQVLRQTREELKAAVTHEQNRVIELETHGKELGNRLKASSVELERARAELEKQGRDRALTEAELRQQLEVTASGQKLARARCDQLEGELADLRQAREALSTRVAGEQSRGAELEKRAQELEGLLRARSLELEEARAEQITQTKERAEAETALRQQLEAVGTSHTQAQTRCSQLEGELRSLKQGREELNLLVAGERDRVAELEKQGKELEKRLKHRSTELDRAKTELEQKSKEHANTAAQLRQQLEATDAAQKLAQARCTQLEGDLADLGQASAELKAKLAKEQHRAAKFEKRGHELELNLKERAAELERSRADLAEKKREHSKTEAELRQQLESTSADRNLALTRCSQLEQDLTQVRQVREELIARMAQEQQTSAELGKRGLELEKRLEQSERAHQVEITEMEDRIRRGVNALTRVTSDLEKERVDRTRSEEQNTVLTQRMQELHAELGRHLQSSRDSQQRISALEKHLRENGETQARLLADLEQERGQAQLAEEQLRRVTELNQRYQQNISSLGQANMVLLSSRDDLQAMLETNLGKLHETEALLQKETSNFQRLGEEYDAAQRSLRNQRQTIQRQESQIAEILESTKDLASRLQVESAARQRFSEESETAQRKLRAQAQTIERQISQIEEAMGLSKELETRLQSEVAARQRLGEELDAAQRSLRKQGQSIERQEMQIKEAYKLSTELEKRLETETTERQRLGETLDAAQRHLHSQSQIIDRQETEIKESREASTSLESRLQKEAADRQALQDEIQVARRAVIAESENRRLEASRHQAALQQHEVVRRRLETNVVRLRHATIKAARAGRVVRQKLRRQTGQPIEVLLQSVRRLMTLENGAAQKELAEGMLEQLLLLKAGIQEPRPIPAPQPHESSLAPVAARE